MTRKKIFYIPGLISLIMLPLLLFIWGPEDYNYPNAMKLNLPSYSKDVTNRRFTIGNVYEAMKHKKIITIDVNRGFSEIDEYVQNRKLDFITAEIERLQFTNDTTTVLKVQFGDQCTYGTFIWVLNHALVYSFKRYALVDNALYFFPEPRHVYDGETFELEPGYIPPPQRITSRWEDVKTNLTYKWRNILYQFDCLFNQQQQNKILAVSFLVLIVLPGAIKMRNYTRSGHTRALQPVQP